MRDCMKRNTLLLIFGLLGLASVLTVEAARNPNLETRSRDPYLSALVIEASTGKVLFEENADAPAYPASVLKLMDLYIVLQLLEQGKLQLTKSVAVTAEASKMGGSQVYLKEGETFSVEEMLYALMVQSANDAATALAIHIAGSKDGFVQIMNAQAQRLGMTGTRFYSVHGLPPGAGQEPDVTTARDLARLCQALLKYPSTLQYTGTFKRPFRPNAPEPFIMQNHNHLLNQVPGCDGLKTGYYTKAGFSIAATAKRGEGRVIAIVLGSKDRKVRDAKAKELLSKGLGQLVSSSLLAPTATPAVPAKPGKPAPPPASAKQPSKK